MNTKTTARTDGERIAELEAENARLTEELSHNMHLKYKLWHNRDKWVGEASEARRIARKYYRLWLRSIAPSDDDSPVVF